MGDEKEQHAEQGGNPVADSVSGISKADRCLAHATGILRRGSIVVQSRVVQEQKENTHTHTAPRALSGRFWLYSTNLLEKSLAGLEKKTGIIQSGTEETLREADEGNTKELRTRVYVYVTAILFGNQEGSNLAATYWLNFEARAGGVEKAKGFQYLT